MRKRALVESTFCVKSKCFNMTKAGYAVHVISDCITSYDLKKIDEMLTYYAGRGARSGHSLITSIPALRMREAWQTSLQDSE